MDEDYEVSEIDLRIADREDFFGDLLTPMAFLRPENVTRELEILCSNGVVTDQNYEHVVRKIAENFTCRDYRWPSQVQPGDSKYDSDVSIEKRFLVHQREGFDAYDRGLTSERVTKGMNEDRKRILDKYLPGWLEEEDLWQNHVDNLISFRKRHGDIWPVRMPQYGKHILSEENGILIRGMEEDEKKEFFTLGKFLCQQRRMLSRLAFGGPYGSLLSKREASIFEARIQILDQKLPGWSRIPDTWAAMVAMLQAWLQENNGKVPRLTKRRALRDSTTPVTKERILEHKLALFLCRMIKARHHRRWLPGVGRRYGYTNERRKILDTMIPGWDRMRVRSYPAERNAEHSRSTHEGNYWDSDIEINTGPEISISEGLDIAPLEFGGTMHETDFF